MTDRVYTPVYTVQPADAGTVIDVVLSQAEREQLPGRHHAVLPLGQPGDGVIGLTFAGTIPAFLNRIGGHRG